MFSNVLFRYDAFECRLPQRKCAVGSSSCTVESLAKIVLPGSTPWTARSDLSCHQDESGRPRQGLRLEPAPSWVATLIGPYEGARNAMPFYPRNDMPLKTALPKQGLGNAAQAQTAPADPRATSKKTRSRHASRESVSTTLPPESSPDRGRTQEGSTHPDGVEHRQDLTDSDRYR